MQIQPLASHDRPGFDCGHAELNAWLQQVARQHQDKGLSRTYVAVAPHEPERICGYYALTLAELQAQHLPPAWRKKLPSRIPGVRLGRLAVALEHQGQGLGELLIVDALQRTRRIADEAAA